MKRVTRGKGITETTDLQIEAHENFAEILGPHADKMEAALGRGPDFFDWVSFRYGEMAVEFLKTTGDNKADDDSREIASRIIYHLGRARYQIERQDAAKAAHEAFQMGELVASMNIKQAWESTALIGEKYRAAQSKKSKEALNKRWAPSKILSGLIPGLAERTDEMGDPVPASELWSEFYEILDRSRLRPIDTSGRKIKATDRMTWKENQDGITFKTFENRISMCRNSNS